MHQSLYCAVYISTLKKETSLEDIQRWKYWVHPRNDLYCVLWDVKTLLYLYLSAEWVMYKYIS